MTRRTTIQAPDHDDEDGSVQQGSNEVGFRLPPLGNYNQFPAPIEEKGPEDEALLSVISELGSSTNTGKVNVYRFTPGKPLAFSKSYLPMEFSLEVLKEEFGPGEYEVRVYDQTALKSRRRINIDKPLNPTPAAPTQNADKLIETMNAGFNRMAEMFAGALNHLAANQPRQKSSAEILEEMRIMSEIIGGSRAPAAPPVDPMAMIETAFLLADKINPRPAGENDLLLEGLKAFAPVLGVATQQGQAGAIPPAQIPAQIQQIPAQIQAAPVQPISPAIQSPAPTGEQDMMKYYVWLLVQNAKADNDPSTYANLFIDQTSVDEARAFALNPQWFELLCNINADVANYRPWFEELRNDVIQLTNPEPDVNNEENISASINNEIPNSGGST